MEVGECTWLARLLWAWTTDGYSLGIVSAREKDAGGEVGVEVTK